MVVARMILFEIFLGAGVALAFVFLIISRSTWRSRFGDVRAIYDSTLDELIKAEREAARAQQELAWLKTTIGTIASRQSLAVLTDEQVQFLSNSISQIVMSAAKSPDRLN